MRTIILMPRALPGGRVVGTHACSMHDGVTDKELISRVTSFPVGNKRIRERQHSPRLQSIVDAGKFIIINEKDF